MYSQGRRLETERDGLIPCAGDWRVRGCHLTLPDNSQRHAHVVDESPRSAVGAWTRLVVALAHDATVTPMRKAAVLGRCDGGGVRVPTSRAGRSAPVFFSPPPRSVK
jgi:hypothetical protein